MRRQKIRPDRHVAFTVNSSGFLKSAGTYGLSKITDGFVYDARAKPAEHIIGGISQIAAPRAANAGFV